MQALGDVADLTQVGSHVLAGTAIAAGGAQHEMTFFVAQAERQAIHLRLGRELQAATAQALIDAAHEIGHFLIAEGIGQRQHRHRVASFRVPAGGTGADLLGRAVGTRS
ncbi:hypothetical protein G6F68_019143 [Rhizopus microsporus]|nr:hypothetical protein G6F68_019143 [Rhizopus microsporus]